MYIVYYIICYMTKIFKKVMCKKKNDILGKLSFAQFCPVFLLLVVIVVILIINNFLLYQYLFSSYIFNIFLPNLSCLLAIGLPMLENKPELIFY